MNTKHYTKEFRLQAARLVVEQGWSGWWLCNEARMHTILRSEHP